MELKYSLKRGKLRLSEGHKYEERENRGLAPIEEGLDSRRVLTRASYPSNGMEKDMKGGGRHGKAIRGHWK